MEINCKKFKVVKSKEEIKLQLKTILEQINLKISDEAFDACIKKIMRGRGTICKRIHDMEIEALSFKQIQKFVYKVAAKERIIGCTTRTAIWDQKVEILEEKLGKFESGKTYQIKLFECIKLLYPNSSHAGYPLSRFKPLIDYIKKNKGATLIIKSMRGEQEERLKPMEEAKAKIIINDSALPGNFREFIMENVAKYGIDKIFSEIEPIYEELRDLAEKYSDENFRKFLLMKNGNPEFTITSKLC